MLNILASLIFTASSVLAETDVLSLESATFRPSPVITFGYVMQVIISLLVVLGLVYLSGKYLLPRMQLTNAGKNLQVVERIMLEPQTTACIIKLKDKAWLITISNKNVTLIDRVDPSSLEG